MAFESRILHGEGKGKTLAEIDDDLTESSKATFRVALGPFAGTDTKRTRKEAHDAFVHRLEIHGHSQEQAARVAHRCARKHDSREG